jgi:hypothetical protein
MLTRVFYAEVKEKTLYYIPPHLAKYYHIDLPDEVSILSFPSAASEIIWAGRCLAVGLPTASVFHSMRAAEIGVRALGTALGVTFCFPIELAEWQNILDQIDAKIRNLKNQPRSPQKDSDLEFYSQAAAQFRYFKDGWRIRVAHARATYDEEQATDVVDHVRSFFVTLAGRLSEPT